MRNVAIFTGTRAEFGLLTPVIDHLRAREDCAVSLIVSGAHLDEAQGLTIREIRERGYPIAAEVALPPIDADIPEATGQCVGEAVGKYSATLAEMKPDLLVVLGDRFEMLAAAIASFFLRIPIAHLYGGETTVGAWDESIRHAVTKLAGLHFTSTEDYRRRVVQLGENPENVFAVGLTALDTIRSKKPLSREVLFHQLGIAPVPEHFALATYHPETLAGDGGLAGLDALLDALDDRAEPFVLFTFANADLGGVRINDRIGEWVAANRKRAAAFPSLGHIRYLSALQHCALVLGNSSSGIHEAPMFGKPVVNIGERQTGRIKASCIVDCPPTKEAVARAITTALSPDFVAMARQCTSPFGDGRAAPRIAETLATFPLNRLRTKPFTDLDFQLE